jgi:hypothetical protein
MEDLAWPISLSEEYVSRSTLPLSLPDEPLQAQKEFHESQQLSVRIVTWNQEAQAPTSAEELRKYLLPFNRYHIIAIGTQECENTIAKSMMDESKEKWDNIASDTVGLDNYERVCSRVLQGSYL